jgi:hypothetical protein
MWDLKARDGTGLTEHLRVCVVRQAVMSREPLVGQEKGRREKLTNEKT